MQSHEAIDRLPLTLTLNPSTGKNMTDRLCGAIETGNMELFSSLLPSIPHESLDSRGYSPIHVAILCHRPNMVDALLEKKIGTRIRCKNPAKKGWNVYHFAAMCLDIDTLKKLKDLQASGYPFNPKARTKLGSSPLHLVNCRNNPESSVIEKQQEVIQLLIGLGCDPLLQDKYGNTVAHQTILWNDTRCLELMLSENGQKYFFRVLFIRNKGSLLPHQLFETRVVPYALKEKLCLLLSKMERAPMKDQLQQKRLRLTDGTYAALSLPPSCLTTLPESVSNPPHRLSREDVSAIFPNTAMPAEQLLNTLTEAGDIISYTTRSGQTRYIFPRCLPLTLCSDPVERPWPLSTVCGRLLTLCSGSVDAFIVYKLMSRILSRWDDPTIFNASQDGFYLEESGVQCCVRLTEHGKRLADGLGGLNAAVERRDVPENDLSIISNCANAATGGLGIQVVVCSLDTDPRTCSFVSKLLTYCVRSLQRGQRALNGGDVQVGVISTLDLMKGNSRSAHVYSSEEVSHAQRDGEQLLHPDHSEPESFASLYLAASPGCDEEPVQLPSPLRKTTPNDKASDTFWGPEDVPVELDGVEPPLLLQLDLDESSEEDCQAAIRSSYGSLLTAGLEKDVIVYLVEHRHLNMREANTLNQVPDPSAKVSALLAMLEEKRLCKTFLEALKQIASRDKDHRSLLERIAQELVGAKKLPVLSHSDSGVSSSHQFNDDDLILGQLSKATTFPCQRDACLGMGDPRGMDCNQGAGGHYETDSHNRTDGQGDPHQGRSGNNTGACQGPFWMAARKNMVGHQGTDGSHGTGEHQDRVIGGTGRRRTAPRGVTEAVVENSNNVEEEEFVHVEAPPPTTSPNRTRDILSKIKRLFE